MKLTDFIQEIRGRIKYLQEDPTESNIAKVAELYLVVLRLQQIALGELPNKAIIGSDAFEDSKVVVCHIEYSDNWVCLDLPLSKLPIGTRARKIKGGFWERTQDGWEDPIDKINIVDIHEDWDGNILFPIIRYDNGTNKNL